MKAFLEISTGLHAYALVSDLGIYSSSQEALWLMAGLTIASFNGQQANSVESQIDQIIFAMKDSKFFSNASPAQLAAYDQALKYLEKLQQQCQIHPAAIVRVPASTQVVAAPPAVAN
jgi:hypothetical protein